MTPTAAPPRPPVDPRIRARRIAVRRDEGRQRLRRLVVVLALLGAFVLAAGAAFSPLLDVDAVRVEGADRSGDAAVLGVAGLDLGEAMVTVDEGRIADAVETLPWVEDVAVSRDWPGTVVVRVEERRPVAAVADGERAWVLVDREGRALERVTDAADLPVLTGLDADVTPGTKVAGAGPALAVAAALPPSLASRVDAVVRTDDGLELTVALPDGRSASVLLGPATDLAGKILGLATVLDEVDPAGLVRIDLRVGDHPVLTRE